MAYNPTHAMNASAILKQEADNLPLTAEEINTAIDTVSANLEDLCLILRAETDALLAQENKRYLALQEQKNTLTKTYADNMKQLQTMHISRSDLSPQMQEKLTHLRSRFQELVKENMRTVERTMRNNERLMGTIVNAVKRVVQDKTPSYGPSFTNEARDTKPLAGQSALTLNTTL